MGSRAIGGLLAVVAVSASVAPQAMAQSLVAGDRIRLYDSYGTTGGGEFNADIVGTSAATDFITFCLETNEYFTPGNQLLVSAISTSASNGGAGGGSPDLLDARTAYLFTQFTFGTLGNYDFGSTGSARVSDANSLQRAIWYLENEISYTTLSSDAQGLAWVNEANTAVSSGAWSGLGDVRVLNLMRQDSSGNFTVRAQDQLYMATPVPEPQTYAMLLAGLGLMGFIARRRRQDLGA
jgi:hypothetical protein